MAYFTTQTFRFLEDLAANNDRAWFLDNKAGYEAGVRDPALRFIADFAPRLERISGSFRADPRPNGGSLFRIHRDTRFSKDKSPYKTYTGIQFRHLDGKDAHAPGFYLHIDPNGCFAGVGTWHPDSATTRRIRDAIVAKPKAWTAAVSDPAFVERLALAGEATSRPPTGYPKDHPLIEDLKRKDFIAACDLTRRQVTSAGFIDEFEAICLAGAPLVKWLCRAVEVDW